MTHDEVTAAMEAEDVDAALVEKAAEVMHSRLYWAERITFAEAKATVAEALAAVLPEIQAQAQQDLITDLLAKDLADVEYLISRYPVRAVPQAALLERRTRIARMAQTEEPTDV